MSTFLDRFLSPKWEKSRNSVKGPKSLSVTAFHYFWVRHSEVELCHLQFFTPYITNWYGENFLLYTSQSKVIQTDEPIVFWFQSWLKIRWKRGKVFIWYFTRFCKVRTTFKFLFFFSIYEDRNFTHAQWKKFQFSRGLPRRCGSGGWGSHRDGKWVGEGKLQHWEMGGG